MSPRLVECVPNFSEGRDPVVIEAIAAAAQGVPGARLLHVDPDHDTHRSVFTLMGEPEAVSEAVFRAIAAAIERVDLREHRGSHPRMGAADVVPFVPWAGVGLTECVSLAQRLGQRVGAELGLPGWRYGEAATHPSRRLLHEVRRGQFEGLARKMTRWAPDFGPAQPHPSAGAVAIGARPLLIAFNLNLSAPGRSPEQALALAQDIARELREFSSVRRDGAGEIVARTSGRLRGVRALGWWAPSAGCAQLTTNLVDWTTTPPHALHAATQEAAQRRGAEVVGSELVGMMPLDALLAAGRYHDNGGGDLIASAVRGLGLDRVRPFDPRSQVIELALEDRT